MITQPLINKTVLRDFLSDTLYTQLQDFTPDEALEYLFHQYYVFLNMPPSVWWGDFQAEARDLLSIKDDTPDQTEYRFRSSRFVHYVQTTLNHYPDPPTAPVLTR